MKSRVGFNGWRCRLISLFLLLLLLPGWGPGAAAEEMRALQVQAREAREALIKSAARERAEARQVAAESRARILADRSRLEGELGRLQGLKDRLKQEVAALESIHIRLSREEEALSRELKEREQVIKELVGVIRVNAKDVDALVHSNLQTAIQGLAASPPPILADPGVFPGMEDIRELAETLFTQVEQSGQVSRSSTTIIDRNGLSTQAEVLALGPFTAAYLGADELGFLRYSARGNKLYALSKLPPARMQRQLRDYLEGKSEAVVMDIGRGAGLQQLSHQLNLWEQVRQGGPIVWPILAILLAGLFIILERVLFLLRRRCNASRLMTEIQAAVLEGNWQAAVELCTPSLHKPVVRVILAGLESRQMQREEMENVLQESILREIPPMERFLSTLGILAAIAPLLGLLGTVTGMIDTFQIITLHGTSDPRLMSGGISEALVTTMLGLGVAIPLMLAQTLLSRAVEEEIGHLEEKGVSLVNIIHKSRLGG
ncbi:MotA/TolQ/ExbB proton channel family protein [Desulfogranum mediterraneum]|uniref:MotA/TolQ/ExbB proton channel family protein n=1 Tax=Desulfogranum mediterraneum TaxID=160661 RepID=UPI00040E4F4A|nr:MotA/TolQ/ExbB proton channel family protein [Desulfogranum mediterraneum]